MENWNSASSTFLPSTTTLDATSSTTAVYGQNISLKVVVAPVAPAAGVPSGDVGILSNDPALYSAALIDVTLNKGQGTFPATPVTAGSYMLFGNYAGDATFAPSTSSGVAVTTKLGTSVLTAGSATFTTTSLPLGSQAVIATYSGDSDYSSSSSAITMLNVSSTLALTITASDAQGDQSSVSVAVTVY